MDLRQILDFERLMSMDSEGDNTPTPPGICRFLYDIISPHYQPRVGLDPCAGLDNRMSLPWRHTDWINFELRRGKDFFSQTAVLSQVEMVLCNPPFSGSQARSFCEHIVKVVPARTPMAFICSTLYFVGGFAHGRDYDWLLALPPITSLIFTPRNAFPGVNHPILIALFNMPALKPFYALPYEYLGR